MRVEISTKASLLLGLLLFGPAGQAAAQPSCPVISSTTAALEQARALRRQMTRPADEQAFELLTCLYAQSPTFEVLLQLYQTEMVLGRWIPALRHLEQAKKDKGFAGLDPPILAQIEKDVAQIHDNVGRLEILAKDAATQQDIPNGTVFINGSEWSRLPMQGPNETLAGPREVRVVAPGYIEQTNTITVSPLTTQPLRRETFLLRLDPGPEKPPLYKRPAFWLGIGAGVVAVSVGLGVGLGVGLKPQPDGRLQLDF